MSSLRNKSTTNKPRVIARASAVSEAIASCPHDVTLTEKARKAAKGFRLRRSAIKRTNGRRMSKDEFRAASA